MWECVYDIVCEMLFVEFYLFVVELVDEGEVSGRLSILIWGLVVVGIFNFVVVFIFGVMV